MSQKTTEPQARFCFRKNLTTKEWEPLTDSEVVIVDPFIDLDITFTWVGGKPTQIVITGEKKTKTMVLSWTGEELNSIATVIT